MKKILFISTLLAAAIIYTTGCKKDSASVNGLVASVTTIQTNNNNSDTSVINYSYDQQGRLTKLEQVGVTVASYTYTAGQVTIIEGTDTIIYTLNAQGLAASSNKGNTYTYDGNGYLTRLANSVYGNVNNNTISGGNRVTTVATQPGVSPITYTYTFLHTPDYRNFGNGFLGKRNVNLVNTEVITYNSTETVFHAYTFDSKGRVQSLQTGTGGPFIDKYTYTYVN